MDNGSSNLDPFNTKRPQIYRLSGWRKLIYWPTALFLKLWYKTWKLKTIPAEKESIDALPLPFVLVGWHNSSFTVPPLIQHVFPRNSVDCLISASKAAAWEVELFSEFGINAIRGSTTRRSIQALREMYHSLDSNRIVLLSPDGPSGPLYSFQPGAIALARKRKVPLVFFAVNATSGIRLNTWDRHLFPYPFSTVTMRMGHILPNDPLWNETDTVVCKRLRRDLLELTDLSGHFPLYE